MLLFVEHERWRGAVIDSGNGVGTRVEEIEDHRMTGPGEVIFVELGTADELETGTLVLAAQRKIEKWLEIEQMF